MSFVVKVSCRFPKVPGGPRFPVLSSSSSLSSSSLNPTSRHLQAIRTMHGAMIRKMLGLKRDPDSSLGEYMRHTSIQINKAMTACGVLWWDDYFLKQIYSWAGHIGRMAVYDPSRVVLQTLKHKSRKYLLSLQSQFGQQCHGRRFHVWRWEKAFYDHFGEDWMYRTIVSETWDDGFLAWLSWRKCVFNRQRRILKSSPFKWMSFDCIVDNAVSVAGSSSASYSSTESSS